MSSNPIPENEAIELVVELPLEQVQEQGFVIVHCRYQGEGAIRIWHSTYLIDRQSSYRSKLVHAENISLCPHWTHVMGSHTFTLYFEALPAPCMVFDLVEVIPQAGGFFVQGITRNDMDVYRVEIE